MAKEAVHTLRQTKKGKFMLIGKVIGCNKYDFYKQTITSTGRERRVIKFGLTYFADDKGKRNQYLNLSGMKLDNVYASKKDEDGKVTNPFPWEQRYNLPEGYNLICKRAGLNKIVDESGNFKNEAKYLTDYDMCEYFHQNLKDDMSLRIEGEIDTSLYDSNGTVVTSKKLVPTSSFLTTNEINFEAEGFKPTNFFQQEIVFKSIAQEKDKDTDVPTGRYIVEGIVIGYNDICEVSFIIENDHKEIAQTFRQYLFPYISVVTVEGYLNTVIKVDEVKEENTGWGEASLFSRVRSGTKIEYVIIGADSNSLLPKKAKGFYTDPRQIPASELIYTEEKINEGKAILKKQRQAKKDFGTKEAMQSEFKDGVADDWGSFDAFDESAVW